MSPNIVQQTTKSPISTSVVMSVFLCEEKKKINVVNEMLRFVLKLVSTRKQISRECVARVLVLSLVKIKTFYSECNTATRW